MPQTIQRKSIISTIFIYVGFAFGAINLFILFPKVFGGEEFGLTRVVNDFSMLAASLATLGALPVIYKFFPFYRHYLPNQKNDLPFITAMVTLAGIIITMCIMLFFQPFIITAFGRNKALFTQYYWATIPFFISYMLYTWLEGFAWNAGLQVVSNFLKETAFRLLTTVFLILAMFHLIHFEGFMWLFSGVFFIPTFVLFYILKKQHALPWHTTISSVTLRLKNRMIAYGSYVFFASLVTVASLVCDTLFLAALRNFTQAGIFAIVQYCSSILEVPTRSASSSALPIVAEHWRKKNVAGIASIYKKSAINLFIFGLGLGGVIIINLKNLVAFMGPYYEGMIVPAIILIIAKWINLGTGLNALIIQTSNAWRFEFVSTLCYALLSIPLNFLLINAYGMVGAAMANLLSQTAYNGLRYWFLYKKFGLQPFGKKNVEVLLFSCLLIAAIFFIPRFATFYVDGFCRTILFGIAFCLLIYIRKYSAETVGIIEKILVMARLKSK